MVVGTVISKLELVMIVWSILGPRWTYNLGRKHEQQRHRDE